jgi:hypothetical protein
MAGRIQRALKLVENLYGKGQAKRLEQASDEVDLSRWNPRNLVDLFGNRPSPIPGDTDRVQNAGVLMAMPPSQFENYARPILYPNDVPYNRWSNVPSSEQPRGLGQQTLDRYVKQMGQKLRSEGGIDLPSELWLKQFLDPSKPVQVEGHEGRHHMRWLDQLGDQAGLVNIKPTSDLAMMGESDEVVERLLQTYFPQGDKSLVKPEMTPANTPGVQFDRPPLLWPNRGFAEGGQVEGFEKGGLMSLIRKAIAKRPDVVWHGSPSGDLRGGTSGLHVGSLDAAETALNARIGVPAEGYWDAGRRYADTYLMGDKALPEWMKTGYNVTAPAEHYLPEKMPTYSGGMSMSPDARPTIDPYRITGEMVNSPTNPYEDAAANARMKGSLTRGNARRGIFYRNEGEDEGSISAALPGPSHLEKIDIPTDFQAWAEGGAVPHFDDGGQSDGRGGGALSLATINPLRFINFVKKIAGSPEQEKALGKVLEHTEKTGNEALIHGREPPEDYARPYVSKLTPGTATSVTPPPSLRKNLWANTPGQPWSIHSHPPQTSISGESVPWSVMPSPGDIANLLVPRSSFSLYNKTLPEMRIANTTGNQVRVGGMHNAFAPPGSSPTGWTERRDINKHVYDLFQSKNVFGADQDEMLKTYGAMGDWAKAHGVDWESIYPVVKTNPKTGEKKLQQTLAPAGHDLLSGNIYDRLGQMGIPVDLTGNLTSDPRVPLEDAMKSWADYAATRNVGPRLTSSPEQLNLPLAEGGVVPHMNRLGSVGKALEGALSKIRTYTGSPYKFDKFDPAYIGKGEGSAAYGHGFYSAENPTVAQEYRRITSDKGDDRGGWLVRGVPDDLRVQSTLEALTKQHYPMDDQQAESLSKFIRLKLGQGASQDHVVGLLTGKYGWGDKGSLDADKLRAIMHGLPPGYETKKPGWLYSLDINAHPNQFLDWDAPLDSRANDRIMQTIADKHPHTVDAIGDVFDRQGWNGPWDVPEDYTGRELHRALTHHDVQDTFPASVSDQWPDNEKIAAASYLHSLDTPGIRFLDKFSRPKRADFPYGYDVQDVGTRNYVMFPESSNLIDIVNREKAEGGPVRNYRSGGAVRNYRIGGLGLPSDLSDIGIAPDYNPPNLSDIGTAPDYNPPDFDGAGALTLAGWKTNAAEKLIELEKRLNAERASKSPAVVMPPSPRLQTVRNPLRTEFPGIYKDPADIIADLKSGVFIPEGENMQRLFGVSRHNLDEISQGRDYSHLEGVPHAFTPPPRGKGSAISEQVLTPRNMQRYLDLYGEVEKHPDILNTRAWYELQPLWDHMAKLGISPEEMMLFNARLGLHSAGANPISEINRGTLAHKLIGEGRLDDYLMFGGRGMTDTPLKSGEIRASRFNTPGFPADMLDMKSHAFHPLHAQMLENLEREGKLVTDTHKIPTYIQGTDPILADPRRPIADSHIARGAGYSDVRTGGPATRYTELTNPEFADFVPWWQRIADQAGEQPRDLQALMWNVLGPQTGVDYIGTPKLEMLSDQIMRTARRLGVSPEKARDLVLTGKAGAYDEGGQVEGDYTGYGDYVANRAARMRGKVESDRTLNGKRWEERQEPDYWSDMAWRVGKEMLKSAGSSATMLMNPTRPELTSRMDQNIGRTLDYHIPTQYESDPEVPFIASNILDPTNLIGGGAGTKVLGKGMEYLRPLTRRMGFAEGGMNKKQSQGVLSSMGTDDQGRSQARQFAEAIVQGAIDEYGNTRYDPNLDTMVRALEKGNLPAPALANAAAAAQQAQQANAGADSMFNLGSIGKLAGQAKGLFGGAGGVSAVGSQGTGAGGAYTVADSAPGGILGRLGGGFDPSAAGGVADSGGADAIMGLFESRGGQIKPFAQGGRVNDEMLNYGTMFYDDGGQVDPLGPPDAGSGLTMEQILELLRHKQDGTRSPSKLDDSDEIRDPEFPWFMKHSNPEIDKYPRKLEGGFSTLPAGPGMDLHFAEGGDVGLDALRRMAQFYGGDTEGRGGGRVADAYNDLANEGSQVYAPNWGERGMAINPANWRDRMIDSARSHRTRNPFAASESDLSAAYGPSGISREHEVVPPYLYAEGGSVPKFGFGGLFSMFGSGAGAAGAASGAADAASGAADVASGAGTTFGSAIPYVGTAINAASLGMDIAKGGPNQASNIGGDIGGMIGGLIPIPFVGLALRQLGKGIGSLVGGKDIGSSLQSALSLAHGGSVPHFAGGGIMDMLGGGMGGDGGGGGMGGLPGMDMLMQDPGTQMGMQFDPILQMLLGGKGGGGGGGMGLPGFADGGTVDDSVPGVTSGTSDDSTAGGSLSEQQARDWGLWGSPEQQTESFNWFTAHPPPSGPTTQPPIPPGMQDWAQWGSPEQQQASTDWYTSHPPIPTSIPGFGQSQPDNFGGGMDAPPWWQMNQQPQAGTPPQGALANMAASSGVTGGMNTFGNPGGTGGGGGNSPITGTLNIQGNFRRGGRIHV